MSEPRAVATGLSLRLRSVVDPVATARVSDTIVLDTLDGQGLLCSPAYEAASHKTIGHAASFNLIRRIA